MPPRRLLRILVAWSGLSTAMVSAQVVWNNGNASWSVGANWNTGNVPGAADTAQVGGGSASLDTSDATIGKLVLSGGAITGARNLTVTGTGSSWSGGTLSGTGTVRINNGASLGVSGAVDHDFQSRPMVNAGTIDWSAGSLRSGNGGSITNAQGATFNATAGGYSLYNPYGGTFTFTNDGTFNRSGTGTSYLDLTFVNTGNVNVTGGVLALRGGGSSSGTLAVAGTGSELQVTNGLTLTDGATVSGAVRITGGTLAANGTINANGLSLEGGTLQGTQTFSGGTVTFSGGTWSSSGSTTIAAGATLAMGTAIDHDFQSRTVTNNGTVNWSAGWLRGGNGSVFTNATGANFNDSTPGGFSLYNPWGGTFTFTNDGTYRRTAGGTTYLDGTFNNNGTIDLQAGDLQFRGGGTMSASSLITAATGTNVYFTNDYTVASGGALKGAGTYRLTGGNFTVNGTMNIATLVQSGGTLAGTNTISGGAFNWEGGTWSAAAAGSGTTIAAGATLNFNTAIDHDLNVRTVTNQGTANWNAGGLRGGSGSVFTNAAGATFNDLTTTSSSMYNPWGGTFTFVNNGSYVRNGAGGTTYVDTTFNNHALVDVKAGSLEFRGGGTLGATGSIVAALGTSIYFRNNYTIENGSSLTGAGAYWLTGGLLNVAGTLNVSTFNQAGGQLGGTNTINGVYNWSGGNWSADPSAGLTTTIGATAALNLTAGSDKDINGRGVINNGTVNWNAGQFRGGQGGAFTNAAGATFNDLNASNYTIQNPWGGAFTFTNNGRYVRKAANTTYVDVPFDNNGTVELQQGDLQFRGGGTMSASGAIAAATGTNVTFTNNYTLANGSALTGAGTYWLTAGTLSVGGSMSVGTFNQTGGILAGTNTINGTLNWSGGDWNAPVVSGGTLPSTTLGSAATLNLSDANGNIRDFNFRAIVNQGTVNWSSGYLRSGYGGTFTNSGTFNDLNAANYTVNNPFGGTFVFTNNGTYNRNASGTTYFDTPFDNNGALNVVAGDLQIRQGGTMGANSVVNVSPGAHLYFTNNYTLLDGAQFLGAGLMNQVGGTLTANGAMRASAFLWSGGDWNAAANSGLTTTIAAGTILNLTDANGNTRDFHGRAIVNQGVVNWNSGYLRSGNGGTFTNAAGATFNDLNASNYTVNNPWGGSFVFTNDGTYVRNVGGTTYFDTTFNNNGTLNLLAGDIQIRQGGTMGANSVVNVAAGAHLYLTNNYTLADGSQLNGAGLINQIGGTLTADGAIRASSFVWSGGNWNAAANSGLTTTIPIGTTLNLTDTNGNTRDFYGRGIANQGTINWSSGYIRSGGGGSFTNAAGATFNDLNASNYTVNNPFGGAFTFTNNGTYVRNVGGTTYFDSPFDNNGTVNLLGGDIQVRQGGMMGATSVVNVAAGAHLYLTNNYTLADGSQFTGAGLINQNGGTLTANGAIRASSFLWSGGDWNAAANSGLTTTIAAGTLVALTDGNGNTRDFYGRGIANQGVINWSSGYLRSGGGGSFTNAAGATFNDLNAAGYTIHNPFGGTFTFANAGMYVKSTAGTTSVQVPFTNSGVLLVQAGTLAFTSTFSNAGGALAAAGGNFTFTNPLDVGNGTLSGSGTVTASLVTVSGVLAPGNPAGTLTISGNLTLMSTTALLIQLGGVTSGTDFDFVNVSGTATIGGTLSASFLNGFQSTVAPGATFTILTGGAGLTGTFGNVTNGARLFTSDGFGSFRVNYGPGSAFGGNSVVLSDFIPVPEPATWAMMAIGALVLVAQVRRKRS